MNVESVTEVGKTENSSVLYRPPIVAVHLVSPVSPKNPVALKAASAANPVPILSLSLPDKPRRKTPKDEAQSVDTPPFTPSESP